MKNILILLAIIPQLIFSQPKILRVKLVPQLTPNWCWAASTQMVLRYKENKRYVNNQPNQCEISEKYKGNCDCNSNIIWRENNCTSSRKDSECAEMLPAGKLDLVLDNIITPSMLIIDTILTNYGIGHNKLYKLSEINFNIIENAINNKHLLIGRSDNHIVVISGYKKNGAKKEIIVLDPYKTIGRRNKCWASVRNVVLDDYNGIKGVDQLNNSYYFSNIIEVIP